MIRHVLVTAALSAVVCGVIFGIFGYYANQPVAVATVALPADQELIIADVAIAAPPLAIDKARTIELLRQSCPDLSLTEQEIKNNFVDRFSNDDYTMTKAEAIIVSAKLRRSGLCG